MTRSIRTAAITAILCVATAGSAATNDFYLNLLQRGIGHVKSSNFDAASKELRIAAFGLVDSIPQFEVAQVYLTIASEHLNNESDARHAAQRLLAAERVEPRYAALSIPDDIRAEFERIVTRILTSDQVAVLHARASGSPAPINPQPIAPIVVPMPQSPAPQPVMPQPQPTPKSPAPIVPPPSKSPAPITAQPVAPVVHPQPAPALPRAAAPAPSPTPQPQPARITNIPKALADADAALSRDDLAGARTIYRALLDNASLDHATLLRVAEGAYRSRDFTTTVRAFDRIGVLRNGEEPYHYYHAVALYETGRYNAAKRELAAAVPFIEITPDVARYRAKIEGAIE